MIDIFLNLIWNAFLGLLVFLVILLFLAGFLAAKDWVHEKWIDFLDERCEEIASRVVEKYESRRAVK